MPLVLLLLLPLMASAQEQRPARSQLEKARAFYKKLDYERALAELGRARRRALTDEETVSIWLYEGIILFELNRKEQAVAAFLAALRLNPDAELPQKVAPKIEQSFQSLRQEFQQHVQPPPQQHPEERMRAARVRHPDVGGLQVADAR